MSTANNTLSLKKPAMTLEQKRSKFAWKCVQGCNDAYVNLAKAAPAFVMNNGLMQTLCFYKAKEHNELLLQLSDWLKQRFPEELAGVTDFESLMNKLLNANGTLYRQATEESLLVLRWIRQFAAAVVRK